PQTVTANFSASAFAISITLNPTGAGRVTCTPNPVAYGGSRTCTPTANAGYTFEAFGGRCSGKTCQLTDVTGDRQITATFRPVAVTVAPVPAGGRDSYLTLLLGLPAIALAWMRRRRR